MPHRKMNGNSKTGKQHIDDIQTSTLEEHFELIMKDETVLDSNLSDVTYYNLPDWYDSKACKQAQGLYARYLAAITVSQTIGLIAVFAVPQITKVLTYTKQSSTVSACYKRYMQTLLHIHKLYISDMDDTDSEWYKSLNTIRWKHQTNSKQCIKANIGGIYQKDMVLTQYAFIAYILLTPDVIGISTKPEEEEAFNHFWRVIGHMLNIPDRLNVCRKTVAETKDLLWKIMTDVYVDYFKNTSSEFFEIASHTLDAIWYIDITVDRESMMSLVYKVHGIEYTKPLSWYTWLNIKYREIIAKLFLVPYIGTVIRLYFNNVLKFIFWYSENYGSLYAWLKFPVKLNLYPKYK